MFSHNLFHRFGNPFAINQHLMPLNSYIIITFRLNTFIDIFFFFCFGLITKSTECVESCLNLLLNIFFMWYYPHIKLETQVQ